MATHDLVRRYGDQVAVNSISLEVTPGTIVGVIGPSGSGKTTLVKMMTGGVRPTSGSVRVLGEDPLRFRRQTRERIGYMPQLFVLYPELTAAENVSFVASLFGILWGERQRRVRQVLEFVELWDARGRRASQLSGGMQRRLELACALVHHPSLIFMDEPTAGIDPILRQTIWDEFKRLRASGRTMVITTQYVGEAEYCDQVAVIARGRLVALSDPESLRRSALGGEVLEVETRQAIDGHVLASLPGVRRVQQPSARRLLVVAESAGATTPRVMEALGSQSVDVASISEYRPSFDEVFAALMEHAETTGDDAASSLQAIEERLDSVRRAA